MNHMISKIKRSLSLLFLLALVAPIPASADDDSTKSMYHVNRATDPIEIDGFVTESAWRNALRLELKYEVNPGENVPPPVQTEMLITYDETRLLVAFICNDPRPSQIRARYRDRDSAWNDDWIGIVLDTFNDERRAYEFLANPFGVQMDMLLDDVNGSEDSSWNAIWDSAGRITETGWEVEVAIPFNQIRFQDTDEPQTWGLDGVRRYPREHLYHIGLFPRDRGNNSYLSQAVKISGFQGMQRGKDLEISPTLTAQRTEVREQIPDGDLEERDRNAEAGINLRWGITPNVTFNGTLNPDFSQVEADAVQLDINTQFALYYPETRPFFLDGADYFSTPLMNLLHTRQIADPLGAAKVTGKEGPHTFGVLTSRDDLTNIIIPGPEGSSSGSFAMENTSAVMRYRYDFGRNSTIGTMFTDRQGGDYFNRVLNVDGRFRFDDANSFTFNVAGSQTKYDENMIKSLGQDSDAISDLAYVFYYNHTKREYRLYGRYEQLGDDFRSDLGFINQTGYRQWEIGGQYNWIGGGDRWFNKIYLSSNYDQTETTSGHLLERELEGFFQYNGPREIYILLGGGGRNRTFQGKEYDQLFFNIYQEMRLCSEVYYSVFYRKNDSIDYSHNRAANETIFESDINLTPGRHLQASISFNWRGFNVEPGRLFTTNVLESRIVYNLNSRILVRAILQYVDIMRDPALYAFTVDERSKDFFTQLLFSYKVNAQTLLYLGYTDGFVGTDQFALTRAQRTFFAKLSYAWLQ